MDSQCSVWRRGLSVELFNRTHFVLLIVTLIILFPLHVYGDSLASSLVTAARSQIGVTTGYDPSYKRIDYPGGDVPKNGGVCTDVIIRAYRKLGVDLQKRIHEDMIKAFEAYPSKRIWGLDRTDRNIDHRRVPNQREFFSRKGESFPVSDALEKAYPGDLLTWMLSPGVPHIGIVSDKRSRDGQRPFIIHNIGEGVVEEDMVADFTLTGWYRYLPSERN